MESVYVVVGAICFLSFLIYKYQSAKRDNYNESVIFHNEKQAERRDIEAEREYLLKLIEAAPEEDKAIVIQNAVIKIELERETNRHIEEILEQLSSYNFGTDLDECELDQFLLNYREKLKEGK